MHRLQRKAGYSAIRYGALAILAFLAVQASTLAQNGASPAAPAAEGARTLDCASERAAQPVTDAAVTLNPSRGWQMVGREIELTITSNNLPANAKPVVCFSWKFIVINDVKKRNYVPADTVRIVQQSPESKQPPKPPSLTLAVPVLSVEKLGDLVPGKYKPDKNVVEYSALDNYAPIAEVRILMFGRDGGLLDVITTVAVVNKEDYCNVPTGEGVRIGGGMIEPSTSKNWQPIGGEIEFTAKSATTFPSDAQINVCFRWKVTKGEHSVFNDSDHIRFLDFKPNTVPSAIKLAVGVPAIRDEDPPSRGWFRSENDRIGSYAVLDLIPEADVRTLVFDKDLNPLFDNAGKIGVTSRVLAVLLALFVLVVAFALLYLVSRKLFPDVDPLLAVITTPRGFASLSQFQIMLWTFVVMTASVYVIALAGDLIVITPGTLILLGISGATVVLARVKQPEPAAPAAPPPPPAVPAAPPAEQPAQAAGATRRPRWSDLVTDEIKGEELDVTRIQMLLFTLVTATFVAIKVITSYEIPDIPDGFLILMGISNGVYVGSKFAPTPQSAG
jgi:hypothetical protein